MNCFEEEIGSLSDVEILQEKKKRIKDLVVSPELNWSSRADLYKKVQIINNRIEKLSFRASLN